MLTQEKPVQQQSENTKSTANLRYIRRSAQGDLYLMTSSSRLPQDVVAVWMMTSSNISLLGLARLAKKSG